MKNALSGFLTVALVTVSLIANASTLVRLSGNYGVPNNGFFQSYQVKAVDFTLAQAETNVNIDAVLGTSNSGATFSAYLTHAIGPATESVLDQKTVSIGQTPSGGFPTSATRLFTGLTLAAGHYFLIIADNAAPGGAAGNDYWAQATTATFGPIVSSTGNTYRSLGNTIVVGNPWQTNFNATTAPVGNPGWQYSVTGDGP